MCKMPNKQMNYRDALIKTFETFHIVAAEIASTSGVGENQISNYKNCKTDLYAENLQALINALPMEAQMHFYGLLLQRENANLRYPSPKKSKVAA